MSWGRVSLTGTSDGIAPRRFSFSRGRTGKGLTLTRCGALVHVSGQAAGTALLRARLTRSLPRKRKSRQSPAVLGPRCGRVPQTGTSDGIAPRRFSFSRGRTGKGLTLTRSGGLVHVSGQAARTAVLRARLTRSLPRKRKSRQSAAVLGPRCGRVPQTGTSDGIAPRRFSFSRGRTGKGLTLTRSGALMHVSGQAAQTALLSGRLPRSLPRKRKSRQSAVVLGPRCGRVPLTGTSDGIAPRRFSFSRGRTGKGLTLTRSGALVHVSGQAVRTALLSGRLARSLPRKRKSRQSAAVLGPRCGRVPLTGTSDGIAPRRFSFSRGRTGKGLTLTRSGALVHVSVQAVRKALLSGRLNRSLPRKGKSRQIAAVLGPRCGRVPLTGTSDGIAPRRFSFSRGWTGKGLTLTRSGALVHVSGQAARTALLRARLTRSLPRKRKSRQSAVVLGPRCGRVPLTGTSDGIAPRRFSFSRGRTGKGLTLTRSGALVHVSGQAARTALLRARLTRSLPRKRKSRQSAAVLGPRCGRVPQTGTSDGIAPRRFSFSRGRTGKGLTLTCSGALVHRTRQDWADGPSQRSMRLDSPARSLENRKWQQSAAVQGLRWGRPQNPRCHRVNAHKTDSISRGRTGKGADARPLWGRRARFWAGRADGPSQGSTRPLAPSKTKVAAERCRSGNELGTCPPDWNERRNRSPTVFIFEGSGGEGTDARPLWDPRGTFLGRAVRIALLGARLPRSLSRKSKWWRSAAVLGPRWGRLPLLGTRVGNALRQTSLSRGPHGEGTAAHLPGAVRQLSRGRVPSALLPLDSPAGCLENGSRSGGLPLPPSDWGGVPQTWPSAVGPPRRWSA